MLFRIFAIAKKELKQVKRDTRTLIIIFIFPIIMLILFGYALNFDVVHLKIGVYDQDRSELSKNFIKSISSTEYFDFVRNFDKEEEIDIALATKYVQCAVVIPKDFSEKLFSKQTAKIQYLIDGVDGNTATIAMSYLNAVTVNLSNNFSTEMFVRAGNKMYNPIDLQPRFWFNPELKTTYYLIPGLVAIILITLAVVLTAVSIVRERELGTIEQINVSPVSAVELLLGKIAPYTLISLFISAIIIIAGHFIFNVEIKGNIFLLFFSILIYLFACLNIGIFVSTIAESQQVAFQMGILISQLPANLLSGFIFPIESMPKIVQIITNITPSKFFIVALRAILVKGAGIEAFWNQLVYLLIFGLILLALSTIRFKRQKIK